MSIFDVDIWHWFISILSTSGLQVKVTDQSSRSQEEKRVSFPDERTSKIGKKQKQTAITMAVVIST